MIVIIIIIIMIIIAVHRRCQRPPKGLGTNKTVEARA